MMFDQTVTAEIGRRSKKATGSHYTPAILARFVAGKILAAFSKRKGKTLRIMDPAVGDGELLEALLDLLLPVLPKGVQAVVYGFDTSPEAVNLAEERLAKYSDVGIHLEVQDFVELLAGRATLFGKVIEEFDIVISNPPYVRTQVMGADAAQHLADVFHLSGRVDLYYVFIRGIGEMLRPGGIVGLICSNRFMTIKSGADVRKRILDTFDVLHIWDLGDTKLFEAAVLPAVLLLQKKSSEQVTEISGFTAIYTTPEKAATTATDCFQALEGEGVVAVNGQDYLVRQGTLDTGKVPGDTWKLATQQTDAWLATVEANTFCRFRDLGKIRVGVKTTADKVFVRRDWNTLPLEQQPELLRPLLTHFVARRYRGEPIKERILYPHEVCDGKRKPVDIEAYPKAKAYLEQHREKLEARAYVIEAGRNWFEIWVPQNPELWARPKLWFPDISETPKFSLDLEGSVVNGDCYWLALDKNDAPDLLWLALAVANSKFSEDFYDHKFHNKLYAGRRRFMTQYVEQFPVPDPKKQESKRLVELAKRMHAKAPVFGNMEAEVDQLVRQAFDLLPKQRKVRSRSSPKVSRQRDLELLV